MTTTTAKTRAMVSALLLPTAAMGLAACSQDSDDTQFAVWTSAWSHTNEGYEGTFNPDGDCLTVTVDGTEYLVALPEGASVDSDKITAGDREFALGEEVTLGGAGFDAQTAKDTTDLTIPSACENTGKSIWLVS